ncbi:hypothetical protein GCM10009735_62520 [Actinomadura chokoriensis]
MPDQARPPSDRHLRSLGGRLREVKRQQSQPASLESAAPSTTGTTRRPKTVTALLYLGKCQPNGPFALAGGGTLSDG